jgi:hypothetical protein
MSNRARCSRVGPDSPGRMLRRQLPRATRCPPAPGNQRPRGLPRNVTVSLIGEREIRLMRASPIGRLRRPCRSESSICAVWHRVSALRPPTWFFGGWQAHHRGCASRRHPNEPGDPARAQVADIVFQDTCAIGVRLLDGSVIEAAGWCSARGFYSSSPILMRSGYVRPAGVGRSVAPSSCGGGRGGRYPGWAAASSRSRHRDPRCRRPARTGRTGPSPGSTSTRRGRGGWFAWRPPHPGMLPLATSSVSGRPVR